MSDLRILFFPGIVGSTLVDRNAGNRQVWLNLGDLTTPDEFESLARAPDGKRDRDPRTKIEADGVLPLLCSALLLDLGASFGTKAVETMPYDWRLDIPSLGRITGARLKQVLDESPTRRVVLVAHSMGGLVAAHAARTLEKETDATRVLGLIALGTPWLGSYDAVEYLRGEGPFLEIFRRLAGLGERKILGVLQSIRGLVDLLPGTDTRVMAPDLYAPGSLGATTEGQAALEQSAALNRAPHPNTFAIVSRTWSTIKALTFVDGAPAKQLGPGDGIVSSDSATAGVTSPPFEVDEKHSTLPCNPLAIRAIVDKVSEWSGVKVNPAAQLVHELVTEAERLDAVVSAQARVLLARLGVGHEPALALDTLLRSLPFLHPAAAVRWKQP